MGIFVELSIIIALAALIGGLMRIFKQPLIMGHILTGILIGPYFLNVVHDTASGEIFSIMGISILLFIVGLNLSPKMVREVGRSSLTIGLLQVLLSSILVFLLTTALDFELISSLYIAISLTFSSTIIILKLLSDKKDIEKLYGRLTIGVLLVQDVIAILILICIASFSSGVNLLESILLVVIKGISVTMVLSLISYYLLPKLSDFFAKSQEYLFLFAVGWGFGLAAVFKYIGFSVEIGALVAGVTLSMSPYSHEISAKLKPLRDFFIIMFFIFMGVNMDIGSFGQLILPAVVLSLFVLLGKPLIVFVIVQLLGYNKKTGFMTGVSISQISEFSLILIMAGARLGHISSSVASLVTFVGLITIAVSTYLIIYMDKFYLLVPRYIGFLEKEKVIKETNMITDFEVILFGCNRSGYDFVKKFKDYGSAFLAIDFNPEVIKNLQKEGVNCIYGDAEDADFLEEINIGKAKLVISTIPDFDSSIFLLERVRLENKDSGVILTSYNLDDALELYEKGANYVILPHFIGGNYVASMLKETGPDLVRINQKRDEHLNYLKERKSLGHSHPESSHI